LVFVVILRCCFSPSLFGIGHTNAGGGPPTGNAAASLVLSFSRGRSISFFVGTVVVVVVVVFFFLAKGDEKAGVVSHGGGVSREKDGTLPYATSWEPTSGPIHITKSAFFFRGCDAYRGRAAVRIPLAAYLSLSSSFSSSACISDCIRRPYTFSIRRNRRRHLPLSWVEIIQLSHPVGGATAVRRGGTARAASFFFFFSSSSSS